jgi:hypothetical protein
MVQIMVSAGIPLGAIRESRRTTSLDLSLPASA